MTDIIEDVAGTALGFFGGPVGSAASSLLGGIFGSNSAKDASGAQVAAQNAAIAEQRRQFNETKELIAPFVESGVSASEAQNAILGLSGVDEQQAILDEIQSSPYYNYLIDEGENAILSNASATGGLRGGNVQRTLSQFRPQILNDLITQRFNQLGTLSSRGQASAVGQANLGQNSVANISNLISDRGRAEAGGELGSTQAILDSLGALVSSGQDFLKSGGF